MRRANPFCSHECFRNRCSFRNPPHVSRNRNRARVSVTIALPTLHRLSQARAHTSGALWHVLYTDGDEEDLNRSEMHRVVVSRAVLDAERRRHTAR